MAEGATGAAANEAVSRLVRLRPGWPDGLSAGSPPFPSHDRSTPSCGVSHGPRASWVRVPIEINTGTVRKVFSGMGQVLSRQSANRVRHLSGRSTTCLSVRRTGQIMNGCCCPTTSTFFCAT